MPGGKCASFACYPRIWDRGDSYSGVQELAAEQWGGEKDNEGQESWTCALYGHHPYAT